jgi:hypothetical protein
MTMHTLHEATEELLVTAREYGSSNASRGDVVAAAYRLAAAKLREQGMLDTATEFDRAAERAEKSS